MKKLPKKYIPIIVLIFLLLFAWAEEVIIGEGYFSAYLQDPRHKILRFSIRAIYLLFIFIIGYLGLSSLTVKWVKALWVYWYFLSVIAAGLRVVLDIYFTHYFNYNLWEFLELFYSLSLTAFPYLFIYCISYSPKKKVNKALNANDRGFAADT